MTGFAASITATVHAHAVHPDGHAPGTATETVNAAPDSTEENK